MKGIRIGLALGDNGHHPDGLAGVIGEFRAAEDAGFASIWIANIFGADAMTLATLAAQQTSKIELGTAVVPTFSRHPFYMAQQALTTQAACAGRFVLGIGPSHKVVIENMLGLSYEKPARHVREYMNVLRQLMDEGRTTFEGETYRVTGQLAVSGASSCPILVGALGPLMRRIAGELGDGTITWMTGPRTLAQEVGPGVRAAAEAAGRAAPRIVAGLPICLTDDPDGARAAANEAFAIYGTLPSYRAMLDLEGAAGPGDVAIVGDEKAIERAIAGLASGGVTDLNAALLAHGPDAKESLRRTTALLAELARA
jgi:F420-dependent oxidoreductase-like protein